MPQNLNRPPQPQHRHNRQPQRPWGRVILAGATVLTAAGVGAAWLTGAFNGESTPANNGVPLDGGTVATASATPSVIGSPDVIPTVTTTSPSPVESSASPSATATSPSPSSSITEAAQASCNAGYFTNDGVVTVNGKHYDRLNFTITTSGPGLDGAHFVLRQLTGNGATLGTRYGQTVSGSPDSIDIPAGMAVGTDLVVTEETSTDTYVCDGNSSVIANDGGHTDWRPSVDAAYTGAAVVPMPN